MIIHPDGRIEGTPEELAAYKKDMTAAPVIVERIVERPWIQPSATPYSPFPWTVTTSGKTTYDGPSNEVWN